MSRGERNKSKIELRRQYGALMEENLALSRSEGVNVHGMTLNQSKQEYQGAKPRLVQLTREKKNSDSAKAKSSKAENDEKLSAHKGLNRSLSWNALSPQSTTAPGWNFYGAEKLQNATSEGLDLELEDPFEAQGAIFGSEKRSLPTISSSGVETLDMDLKNLSIRYPQFDSLDEHILSHELDKEPEATEEKAPTAKPRTDCAEIRELRRKNGDLVRKSAELKGQVECLQSEKNELINVNHAWEAQYRKLQEHVKNELQNKDNSFQRLQKQMSEEHRKLNNSENDILEQKDSIIEEQAEKIRVLKEELGKIRLDSMKFMQTKYENDLEMRYQRAKKLFQAQKKENELLVRREQTLLQECQMRKEQEESQDHLLSKLTSRNQMLEAELKRLADIVEASASGKRGSSQNRAHLEPGRSESGNGTRRQDSSVSDEQIEVLKQQIAIYAEDFNSEKEEKNSLLADNKKLADKIRELENELEDLRRQIQLYEHDIRLEKEEKARKLRQNQLERYNMPEIKSPPGYTMERQSSPDMHRRYQEYCELVVTRNKMDKRINQLENLGVDEFPAQDVFFKKGFLARGAGQTPVVRPSTPEKTAEDSMFYGGDVVRDSKVFEKYKPGYVIPN